MTDSVKIGSNQNASELDRHGKIGTLREFGRIFLQLAMLFISAGRLSWINAWVYAGLILILQLVYTIVLINLNPQLLNERGKGFKKGTKSFDIAVLISFFLMFYVTLIISGLDAGRYGWSDMSFLGNILGAAVLVLAFIFILWAMTANTHFEGTVRIQDDRDHKVCSSGPYRIVRHPGYTGMIFATLGTPLILSSWWGLVPAGAAVFLIMLRTMLEDRTLQNELTGYPEYAKQTRHRLIPFVW